MSSQPKPLNAPSRAPLRLDGVSALIDEKLDSEPMILNVLVVATAKGGDTRETWARLHQAAIRDDRLVELGSAYEELLGATKLKLLTASAQADVLTHAASFFEEALGDVQKAVELLRRAVVAIPTHADAFSRLEAILSGQDDTPGLIELYAAAAAHRSSSPEQQLSLLRRAAELAECAPDGAELALKLYQQIARLDPSDGAAMDAIEAHYLRDGRAREAVKWFEQLLTSRAGIDETEEMSLRERLLLLYRDHLSEIERAIVHVEKLLAYAPRHRDAWEVAGRLLEHKALCPRAAAALADSNEKLGEFAWAASMLEVQLSHTRGPRRLGVQKRLAVLRTDRLRDLAGALPLLEEIVTSDVSDSEMRHRYQRASAELGRQAEAYRVLSLAAASTKDPVVSVAVQLDLARFSLERGDETSARGAFERVLADSRSDAIDEGAVLRAAQGLASLYRSDEPGELASVLELVRRLEPDEPARLAACERLARLYQDDLGDPARAIDAWRTLVSSPKRARALDALGRLYESTEAHEELAGIIEIRSQEEADPEKARVLAFRAAEIRTSHSNDARFKVAVWDEFLRVHGPSREAHAHLLPLLQEEQSWSSLAMLLRQEILLAGEKEKGPLLIELAQVSLLRLADPGMAIEALRDVLAIDPKEATSRRVLEELLASKEGRLAAAQILEPIYRVENDGRALLGVLDARLHSTTAIDVRTKIFAEMVGLLDEDLGESDRALALAGDALRDVIGSARWQISTWLNRVEELALKVNHPATLATTLSRALGDRPVDSYEMFLLAQRTGEALLAIGDSARGLAVFRTALAFDPACADLAAKVDALVMQQGSPTERISVHRASLERCADPFKRRDILHQIALIEQRELGDTPAAIATWHAALLEDPDDTVAQELLLEAHAAQGDSVALYAELERALSRTEGEHRGTLLLKAIETAAQNGESERSLAHCRELLANGALGEQVLAAVERAVEATSDPRTLGDLLEYRIAHAPEARTESAYLERLGDLQSERLADVPRALVSWKRAARALDQAGFEPERARRLYAKVVATDPSDREASGRLAALYQPTPDLSKPLAYESLLLNAKDERQAANLLVAMEPWATRGGASQEFCKAVDVALGSYLDAASRRISDLLTAKARVLAADPARPDDAARLFRALVGGALDDGDAIVKAFETFLNCAAPGAARDEDRRWLEAWRARKLPEIGRAQGLLASAGAHESVGDRALAIEAYRRALEADPERVPARFAIVRLLSEMGDVQGALAALGELRPYVLGDVRTGVELQIGALLADKLEDPDQALDVIAPVLDGAPDDPTALFIIERALGRNSSRTRAVAMLERACEAAESPARAARILRILVNAPLVAPEFAAARPAWFTRLLELEADEPEAALATAVRAASDYPEHGAFWDAAERLARALGNPAPVADAYRRLLERPMKQDTAEVLGKRAVDFHEEWYDDREKVIDLLRQVHMLHGWRWAFDRLKLALSTEERYEDLFALYDGAIRSAAPDARVLLIEEAAEAAKDLARDVDRAILYLEHLSLLRPEETATLSTLERLYERAGHTTKLARLLAKRLEAISDANPQAQATRARLASLLLDTGDRPGALGLVEEMLARESGSPDAYQLLARLFAPDGAPTASPEGQGLLPAPMRTRAATLLKNHYLAGGALHEVARVLQLEIESAEQVTERVDRQMELATLQIDSLGDHAAALETIAALVRHEPRAETHRMKLASLAERLDRRARQAEVLVESSAGCDAETRARLLIEAAGVHRDHLEDVPRAIELLKQVVEDREIAAPLVLAAARELEPLLGSQHLVTERCSILEKIASLLTETKDRRWVLGQVAQIASEQLVDHAWAARAWRARLAEDETDREALDGLVLVLESARLFSELIDALEARARVADPAQARKDRGRIARIHADQLGAAGQAIATWMAVRETHGSDEECFRQLSSLLTDAGRFRELAALVEEEARTAKTSERQITLWGMAGAVHREQLGEPEAAARAYANAVLLNPCDRIARKGLAMLQGAPEARSTVLAALSRACVAMGEWEEATELASELTEAEEVPTDVARAFWWGVAKHQRDVVRNLSAAESALERALRFDENSTEILEALARVQSRAPGRAFVLTMMRLSEANGGDLPLLREAAEVAVAIRSREDPLLARVACERLFELALERWTPGGDNQSQGGDRSPRVIAGWALAQLVAAAREANDDYQAFELLRRGAELPFATDEIQRMKRDAAEISAERLADRGTALSLYRELFARDPESDVAIGSLDEFASLLEAFGYDDELTGLFEEQARLRTPKDRAAARLWAKAGQLAEQRLHDMGRSVANYTQGAELGELDSLEALARIRLAQGDDVGATAMLERICELSSKERLVENTLNLVDALTRGGQASLARTRLERTLAEVGASEAIASRLAELYRRDEAWEALAGLLMSQAKATQSPVKRLAYLAEAADLYEAKLANPEAMIPLLEQIVDIDPDNTFRRLALASALLHLGRADDAIRTLEAQVARYASRRPKERALVHFALAQATTDPRRGLAELEIASRIDPTHPGILFALGRRAFQSGHLDLAEHTYKSLLLLCRGAREDAEQQAMRIQLLSDLAEIADRKNEPERAAELRVSAKTAAESSALGEAAAPATAPDRAPVDRIHPQPATIEAPEDEADGWN